MTYPHHPAFRYRRHLLIAVLGVAAIAGVVYPGQSLSARGANLVWTVGASATGFFMVWLVLQFNVAIKIFSPRTIRGFGIVAFYFYAPGALALVTTNMLSTPAPTQDDVIFCLTVVLPCAFAASAGAYAVYSRLLPSNTSLERTRER
jgi:hypothetical protein